MNKQQMIEIFTKEQRIEPVHSGWRREESEFVVRHVALFEDHGFISFSQLMEDNAERVIEEELRYFNNIGQPFEWKLYDYDQPARLKQILEQKGFSVEEPEALLILDIESQESLLNDSIPNTIKPITDNKGVDELIQLENDVWNTSHDSLGERLKRDLIEDPEHLHIYGAYEDGKLVSAAWMYLHKGTSFGSLWGGTTLPNYRKKGYYTSLLAIRAGQAWSKGYKLLTVDASPMSSPILQKRGFELVAYSYPCMSPKR
ncbi:GNAT family N-acetyltransferase [Bacillus salitolerans]|uniref:GNAT family N-acetyltransferase n=1 Tax=Bacillus salitolerans TaxID=1437434 RepID=A0ABW4LYV1_9BACI